MDEMENMAVENDEAAVNDTATDDTPPDDGIDIAGELNTLKGENRRLRTKLILSGKGALPEQLDNLMRLWDEPAEGDEGGRSIDDYADEFKAKFPWGFAQKQAPVETDERRYTQPSKATTQQMARREAFAKGDIQTMLSMNQGTKRS